jgi:hypothetical protein
MPALFKSDPLLHKINLHTRSCTHYLPRTICINRKEASHSSTIGRICTTIRESPRACNRFWWHVERVTTTTGEPCISGAVTSQFDPCCVIWETYAPHRQTPWSNRITQRHSGIGKDRAQLDSMTAIPAPCF